MSTNNDKKRREFNSSLMQTRLEKLRGDQTQDYLAKKIGVSRQTYSDYERGKKTDPPVSMIAKLSDYYEESMDYVLNRTDYTSEDLEDIGKETGLREDSIKALQEMAHSTKEDGDVYYAYKETLETINIILSQTYYSIIQSKADNIKSKTKSPIPFYSLFQPMHDYIYSDKLDFSIDKKDLKPNDPIWIDREEGFNYTYSIGELFRAKFKDQIINCLDAFRQYVYETEVAKDGKHKTKR